MIAFVELSSLSNLIIAPCVLVGKPKWYRFQSRYSVNKAALAAPLRFKGQHARHHQGFHAVRAFRTASPKANHNCRPSSIGIQSSMRLLSVEHYDGFAMASFDHLE